MQFPTKINKNTLLPFSPASLPSLQLKKDEAEKRNENPFADFDDLDILNWYIHERQHTNAANERSERTKKEYEKELRQFISQLLTYPDEIGLDLGDVVEGSLFKSLSPRHLRRWQEWLIAESPYVKKRGAYSQTAITRKTTIIRSFFQYLHRVGYIIEETHTGLRKATVRKDDRPNRDLGPGDVVIMLRGFREIEHTVMFGILLTMTATGLRNEEFCRLDVSDIKRDRIQGGYFLNVLGKGNKRRQIPLKAEVYAAIQEYRKVRGLPLLEQSAPDAPVFTTSRGTRFSPSYLNQYMKKEMQKISPRLQGVEVDLTPHVFRHAFAIISHLNKVDIYDIMRSLGHEKIETTMIYLEKIFAKERHAVNQWTGDALGEFLG
ncbi:tyrosine-type recombinase/integrase [Planococcus lenghuensis]|uniref:Integrase n=1 Tax=Planococcus lenghuensis TaxID=2213202 RepID=A0A1Q2L4Q8_9BACL|nr:tyrosine-type recombinase/integrase [Planococcus lenghuensis]AQQ55391.1 integrase [Planococcus lenghuensis]